MCKRVRDCERERVNSIETVKDDARERDRERGRREGRKRLGTERGGERKLSDLM